MTIVDRLKRATGIGYKALAPRSEEEKVKQDIEATERLTKAANDLLCVTNYFSSHQLKKFGVTKG